MVTLEFENKSTQGRQMSHILPLQAFNFHNRQYFIKSQHPFTTIIIWTTTAATAVTDPAIAKCVTFICPDLIRVQTRGCPWLFLIPNRKKFTMSNWRNVTVQYVGGNVVWGKAWCAVENPYPIFLFKYSVHKIITTWAWYQTKKDLLKRPSSKSPQHPTFLSFYDPYLPPQKIVNLHA